MIQESLRFYKHLQEREEIKNIFYHFKSLLTITQYELLFKDIKKYYTDRSASILDWGSGNGWFSYYLLYNGFRNVTSYGYGWDDIGPAMGKIQELKAINGAECKLTSPSQLPFESNSYDLVFSIGVLEHVHETGGDQLSSLQEIHRVLKTGGIFYCYHFPNQYTWIEFLKKVLIPQEKRAYLHTKKFTKKQIEAFAGETGFEILKIRRYNFLPYNLFRENRLDSQFVSFLYKGLDRMINITPLNTFSQCYTFIARKL
jgi:SAM-dependent methyltransferase